MKWLSELAGGLAYWLSFLLLLEVGNVVLAHHMHQPLSPSLEAARIACASFLGALTAPPLLSIVRRFSLNGVVRWRNLLTQFAAAATTSILLLLIGVAIGSAAGIPQRPSIQAEFAANGGLLFYCVLAFIIGGNLLQQVRRGNRIVPLPVTRQAEMLPVNGTFVVKEGHKRLSIEIERINWVESQGNYVSLHCEEGSHLVRDTLSSIEKKLDPALFRRVHRRAIVRLDRIEEISPLSNGDQRIILRGGTELRASRTYRNGLELITPVAAGLAMSNSE